jgi:hypothetical protein
MQSATIEKPFTVEKLLSASFKHRQTIFWANYKLINGVNPTVHRNPNTIQGFLTKERVKEMFTHPNFDQLLFTTGLNFISNEEVFFLSDDCTFGHRVLPTDFTNHEVSGQHHLLGNGSDYTPVDEILLKHGKGKTHLNTLEELVDYLNKKYGQ